MATFDLLRLLDGSPLLLERKARNRARSCRLRIPQSLAAAAAAAAAAATTATTTGSRGGGGTWAFK
jgi:hypothetical protein